MNYVDTLVRSGRYPTATPFPFIIGRDLAGVVAAVGEAVTEFREGDAVWCNSLGHNGRQGAFAGLLRVRIGTRLPLEESAQAHRLMERGTRGRIVVLL